MSTCNATDNVDIILPELIAPPGTQICVPITMNNFTDILGASFNLSWDPTVLDYVGIQNPNPALGTFTTADLNVNNVNQGYLGIIYSDFINPNGTTLVDGSTFLEVCFSVIAPLGTCTPLDVESFPSLVTMDYANGQQAAITIDTGQVCVDLIPLDVKFYVDKPNCDGTASVGVIISGGDAPYDITWKMLSGGATKLITALVADTILTDPLPEPGPWIVCVTDGNGAGTTICDTITIDVPTLGATLTVTQMPTCNGGMDGELRADVSVDGVLIPNPGASITFSWNTAPTQSTQTISNIKAGNYSVTVTDTNTGCTVVAAGSLSQPAAISINAQISPASCPGVADGQIVTTASGGTPGSAGSEYNFAWEYSPNISFIPLFNDDSGTGNPFTMTNKAAGYYLVTVTDGNGCTYVHPVEIEIPNSRELSIDIKELIDPLCAGLANGSISIQVNAQPAFNNPDFLFFWNAVPPTPAGPYPQANMADMSMVSNLPAGTFQLLALETSTGCADTASFVLVDPQPLSLSVVNQKNPSCQLQNDGSISVIGSGGVGGPNYNYTWGADPSVALPPGSNQQNLTPGTYTVTMTDGNGCKDSLTIPLPLPTPPAFTSVDSTSVVCGADGCLSVTAPTATSFQWTTLASGNIVGVTAQVCDLPGDTYVITIRDAQNCVNTDTITLGAVIPLFFADTLLMSPTCHDGDDGSIALDVQGGTPGYTYAWGSGQNTPVIFPVQSGNYMVTVTDLRDCTLTGTFNLANPPAIILQYNAIAPASCPGVCDGQTTLVTYYNTVPPTPSNFDFIWSDLSTDSVRTDLCPGYTSVTVTDPSNNCFRIDSIMIGSPPAFTASFDTIPTTCFGGDDGEARVMVSGGNGVPYTYLWSNNSMISTATGLSAGPVTLTVTDNGGCTVVLTTNVTQPDSIVVKPDFLNIEDIDCYGNSTGQLAVTATGGNPGGYTYKWENAAGTTVGTSNPLADLPSGSYSVTATDPKGCIGELLNYVLSDPPAVQGIYLPWDEIVCNGDETTLFIDTIFGGSGSPYQYSLDYGVYLDPGFPINMGGGEHYITYIDRQGCEYTDTIFVPEPDPILVTFDPNEVEIELGDSLQLLPIITGAVVDMFDWTPADLVSNPDTLEPYTRTYESQQYTIVVYDEKGCSATSSIKVNIDPNRNVYIPNAFIPGNPKGLNDHFNPIVGRGVQVVNYMRVFDRWGSLMYERENFYPNNNDFAEGWDGRYRGDYVNPGVFVYAIEVRFLDGRVLLYRGDVTVIR